MDGRRRKRRTGRLGFWIPALLWLPAGVVTSVVVRFGAEPAKWASMPMAMSSLVPVAPCGLPLALACRRLWRLGYRRVAWTVGTVLGAFTVAATLVAGLLGPIAILVFAVVISLPVWVAAWRLGRRPRGLEFAPSSRRPGSGRSRGPFSDGR